MRILPHRGLRSRSISRSRDTAGARTAPSTGEHVPAEHASPEDRRDRIGREQDEFCVGPGLHHPLFSGQVRLPSHPQRQATDFDVAAEDVEQADYVGCRKHR